MKSFFKAGLAIAALTATSLTMASPANAGSLYERGAGSMKDTVMPSSAGRCYLRGDVGYSHSADTSVRVQSPRYRRVDTASEDIEGAWMGEIGIGCGSGSRGFRADLTLGYRGERDIDGIKTNRPGFHFPGSFETSVSTLTAMANLYYDLGRFHGFVPYVGAGLGIARHDLDNASFNLVNPWTNRSAPSNNLSGSDQTNFAWSLMAGVAYQISHRAVLDFGYRYIDMGEVATQRGNICSTACGRGSRDRLIVDDLDAHEFKIGLRYHFGGSRQMARSYK